MDRFKFEENFEFVCRCFESLSDTEDLMPCNYVRKLRKKIWQNSGFSGFQARVPKKVDVNYREVLAEKVEKRNLPSRNIFGFLSRKKHKETDSDVSKVEPVEKIAEADEVNILSEAEADISAQFEDTAVSDEIEVKES